MKKKLKIIGGICGILLIVCLIFAAVPVVKAYNESGNLLILYANSGITTELDSMGLPYTAEEVQPGVWHVRSKYELIPMIQELMRDKAEADPVYEDVQEDMFVLIISVWLIFTAVCLIVAFTTKKYVRWTAFALAFLGCFVCTMVLNEVVCRVWW